MKNNCITTSGKWWRGTGVMGCIGIILHRSQKYMQLNIKANFEIAMH
jgi:hypothetical protein